MNKYHAKKQEIDGIVFDSKREAARYLELKLLERAGEIGDLEVHPIFPIKVNDMRVCAYEGDFSYHDRRTGRQVIEDVKGVRTPVYRLKKKLLKAVWDIDIVET